MRKSFKSFLISVLVSLIVFGVLAFFVVDCVNDQLFTYELETGDLTPRESLDGIKGRSFNLLFVCVDDVNYSAEDSKTAFIMLVRFDKERAEATFTAFPDGMRFSTNGAEYKTLDEVYKSQGDDALSDTVKVLTGVTVDRYVVSDLSFICDFANIDTNYTFDYKNARPFVMSLTERMLGKQSESNTLSLSELLAASETNVSEKDVSDNSEFLYSYNKLTTKPLDIIGEKQTLDGNEYFVIDIDKTVTQFLNYRKIYKKLKDIRLRKGIFK